MVQDSTTPLDSMMSAQSGGMSDHLVRLGHLKALMKKEGWNQSELARQCGKTPQQVYSWFKATNGRQIAERLARELEERLGLARYALDDRQGPTEVRDGEAPTYRVMSAGATKRSREAPVLAWAGIEAMLNVENSTLKHKATHLETFAVSSSRAKFVQMPDDSMASEIALGDHLLFDPTEAPRAGDVVLIRVSSGEHFVRTFRPRTAFVFEATPANPAYQALDSVRDDATVVAVMVEHRRYRRA